MTQEINPGMKRKIFPFALISVLLLALKNTSNGYFRKH
jgi:hypothetical protein